jgi:Leucine-rich repeat (LRR) protein
MGNDVSKRIEHSSKTNVLSLEGLELKKVPPLTQVSPQLRLLSIARNQITAVPATLAAFVALKTLDISHNAIGMRVLTCMCTVDVERAAVSRCESFSCVCWMP